VSAADRRPRRLAIRADVIGLLVGIAGLGWAIFTFFIPSTDSGLSIPPPSTTTTPDSARSTPSTTTAPPEVGPNTGTFPTATTSATNKPGVGPIPGPTTTAPGTTTTEPLPLTDDFAVGLYNGGQCFLRNGENGVWDINLWFTIGWTSTNGTPLPANKVRLTTDVGRAQDTYFSIAPTPPGHTALNQPGNVLDTLVDQDDRYLDRLLRVTVTVDPDNAITETSEPNNTIILVVDLRTSFPPPNTRQAVNCYQE
jgi:hypothetical protein